MKILTKFKTLFLLLILIYFLFFTQPNSLFNIIIFNFLLTFLFYQLLEKFFNKKYTLIASLGFFMFILNRSLKVFDVVNFIIIFLFLLTVYFLIK